jgi:hypothetical protein
MILAESASNHPDGTFSLLRGGISQLYSHRFPVPFDGAIIIRIVGDPAESGTHSLRCVVVHQDGGELSRFEVGFDVREGGGGSALVLKMRQTFAKPGYYSFRVAVDSHVMDDESFVVMQLEPPDAEAGKAVTTPSNGGA